MTMYKVTVNIEPMVYEIDADSEESALDIAKDMLYDEPMYDVIGESTYEVVKWRRTK